MRKKLRIVAYTALGLLLVCAVGLLVVYRMAQYVPEFYRQAVDRDQADQRQASEECLQQITALFNDIRRLGKWEAVFTANQINGWLAVDLVENHPDVLPPAVRDPRVEIKPQEGTVACLFHGSKISTVYSLTFDVQLSGPDVVAVRIRRARAGSVPAPLTRILDEISRAARAMDVDLEWRTVDNDPVAMITVSSVSDANGHLLALDTVELRDGELYVAGHTEARAAKSAREQGRRR